MASSVRGRRDRIRATPFPILLLTRPSPLLPYPQMRTMPLKKFQEEYPSDFQSGALEEIRERYAAMAEAAKQAPLTTRGKRGAEPPTVMRTVRAKRTQDPLQMKQPRVFARQLGPSSSSLAPVPEAENVVARNEEEEKEEEDENDAVAPLNGNLPAPPVPRQTFNGLPLQTPMPFAGAAVPVPVTMLAQKRAGARTKAVAAPDAAIITTADGKQWALGKEGIASIPDSHKAEVEELLSAQFSFLAAALGKTVFEGRGRKRR